MRTIAEWLASIGLRRYAQRLAERAVDLPAVRDLIDRNLAELGVGSIAARCCAPSLRSSPRWRRAQRRPRWYRPTKPSDAS